MATTFFILCIVLAVLGLFFCILGLVLNKSSWKFKKFNENIIYKEDNSEPEELGKEMQKLWHKEISLAKLKGIRGGFSFKYQIPEFYKKITSGDKQAIIHAFILFGLFSFAVFTFLAIGIGLVNGGDEGGWYFISIPILTVMLLTIFHIRQYRKSNRRD